MATTIANRDRPRVITAPEHPSGAVAFAAEGIPLRRLFPLSGGFRRLQRFSTSAGYRDKSRTGGGAIPSALENSADVIDSDVVLLKGVSIVELESSSESRFPHVPIPTWVAREIVFARAFVERFKESR